MDMNTLVMKLTYVAGSIVCFLAAIFVLVRCTALNDASDAAFVVPVMCAVSAVVAGATGLTMILRILPESDRALRA